MKKIYFLILVCAVPLSLFGQPGNRQYLGNTYQDLSISEITGWEKYRRTEYTYDSNGNYTEINSYWWSSDTNKWYVYHHHDYYYDTNGNMTDHYDYEWSKSSNEWVGQHHDKYIYDSVGNRIEDIRWASDPGVPELVEYWRHLYAYDSAGNEIERINYLWNYTSEWITTSRYVYAYDSNGNYTESIRYIWDKDSINWKLNQRYLYIYDVYGNITEHLIYLWDLQAEWVKWIRYVNTYDVNGNNTNGWAYTWDTLNNKWVEEYHGWDIYVSDSTNGNILERYSYSWYLIIETGDTITSAKYITYIYDDNGNKIEEIEYKWLEPTTSMENNSLTDNSISVYPNPITDRFTIQTSEIDQIRNIEIIDTHGRIVRRIDHIESKSITLTRDNLSSGLYFIRIHADKMYVKKVIIR